MSHNICGDAIAYFGERPWHGIGTELKNPATAVEAIRAAKLDYAVEKEPIFLSSGKQIANNFATVRKDNSVPLGVVGKRYQIIQNAEAFNFFDSVVGDGQAIYHTAGALGKGERIWILAKLPKDLVIAKDDEIEKFLILTNNHNGLSCLQMYFSPIRVVCQNTLNASIKDAKDGISIRHTGDIKDKVDEARKVLNISFNYYKEFEKICKSMVDVQMDSKKATLYFSDVIGIGKKDQEEVSTRSKNTLEKLVTLWDEGKGAKNPAVRHTLYTAYNAVAEYTDHERTVKNLKKNPTSRLNSIWFGSGAVLKQKAFDKACALMS